MARFPQRLVLGAATCTAALAFASLASGGPSAARSERGRADPVIELGRRLFFDPAVSRSGHNSCASCHDPAHGFASDRPREDDDFSTTRRRSQTLVDAALGRAFHWDGEFDRVEDLVAARLGAPHLRRGNGAGGAIATGPEARGSSYAGTPSTPPPTPEPAPGYGGSGAPPASGDATGSGEPSKSGSDGWVKPEDKPAAAASGDGAPSADPAAPPYGTDSGEPEVYGSGHAKCGQFYRPQGAVYSGKRAAEDPPAPEPTDPKSSTEPDGGSASTPTTPTDGGASTGTGSTNTPSRGSAPTDGGATSAPATGAPGWLGGESTGGDVPPELAPDPKDPARTVSLVADRVNKDGRYGPAFILAFGSPHVTTARLARAISAFVESIRSTESAYDRFVAGDERALSASARRGLELFRGKAACTTCHAMDGAHASFTDDRYHVTGIAMRASITQPVEDADGRRVRAPYDAGRFLTTRNPKESGAFKTPTLRDVAARAPYMHDGSLATLGDVVRHYAKGAFADPNLDPALRGFDATPVDVADLSAFLESLSSETRPGAAPAWPARATKQSVRFLDAKGRPLAGLRVRIVPAGDVLPGAVTPDEVDRFATSDAKGTITFAPTRGTHARLDLPDGLRMPQGPLVPDVCDALTVRLPVEGTTTLVVSSRVTDESLAKVAAVSAPDALSLPMFETLRRFEPARAEAICRRTTTFRAEGSVVVADRKVTRYRAWVPVGAAERAIVEVPSATSRRVFELRLVEGAETRVDTGP